MNFTDTHKINKLYKTQLEFVNERKAHTEWVP